jgi:cyanophycinase
VSRRAQEQKLERFKEEPLRPGESGPRPKGTLLIIGGHEDKKDEKLILRSLAERVGSGKLVVATLATQEPRESWEEYERVFRGLGVPHVFHLLIEARGEADTVAPMRILEGADAVFFTGGDQLKITSLIGDTPVYSRIMEIFREGGTIAGTSAGASVMSETMMIGGKASGSHRISENLRLAAGFGFAKDVVIDQHFAERGRVSRLLAVVAQNPRVIGIGIDENTAIEFEPDREFRVIGEGGVTVLDGRHITYTNLTEEDPERTMSLYGVTMHLLSQGDTFDLRSRTPTHNPASEVDEEFAVAGSSHAEDAADDE